MTTVPCPGCSAAMALAQEVCPSCRRPRSADEIELGRLEIAAAYERRKALPLKLLGWAVLAAACAVLYVNRAPLLAQAARVRAGFDAEMEKASDPARQSRRAPTTAVWSQTPAGAAAPAATLPEAEPSPSKGVAEPPSPPGAPGENLRRYYGVIYDLISLRPVANARVNFARKNGDVFAATITNTSGHYFVDFFPSDLENGVLLSASAPGYRTGQLMDSGAPYRERSLESRRQLEKETTDSDLSALMLQRGGADVVALDLVLLPSKP